MDSKRKFHIIFKTAIDMKDSYTSPAIEVIALDSEQCILNGSNVPGFDPGTDLDDLLH